jgi:hypothetical protein
MEPNTRSDWDARHCMGDRFADPRPGAGDHRQPTVK